MCRTRHAWTEDSSVGFVRRAGRGMWHDARKAIRHPPACGSAQERGPDPAAVRSRLPCRSRRTTRPETYSVVVSNVRVDDLLFALARTQRSMSISPRCAGTVTLNAIDQTLPQLLNRIARQIDMRFEMDGPNLMVMRDTPFFGRTVDYISASRNVKMQSTASTQFSGGRAPRVGGRRHRLHRDDRRGSNSICGRRSSRT